MMTNELRLTFRLNIDILWVLFLVKFLHAKYFRVFVEIVQHVSVLVAPQPLVLPIKPDWGRTPQHLPQIVLIVYVHLIYKTARLGSVVFCCHWFF